MHDPQTDKLLAVFQPHRMRRIIETAAGIVAHAPVVFLIQHRAAVVLFSPGLFGDSGGKRREIFEVENTSALGRNLVDRKIGPVLASGQDAVLIILE